MLAKFAALAFAASALAQTFSISTPVSVPFLDAMRARLVAVVHECENDWDRATEDPC